MKSPGQYLLEALEARGWSQQVLCDVINRSPRVISEIVNEKRAISPETAIQLAAAFGNSPEFWMEVENSWQLDKTRRRANLMYFTRES